LAAFQVIIIGRFWVIAEEIKRGDRVGELLLEWRSGGLIVSQRPVRSSPSGLVHWYR
jgi:hypothetical protein